MIFRSSIVLVFAVAIAAACWLSPEPRMGDDCGVVMSLPQRAGLFVGRAGEVSKEERDKLPSDTEIARMVYQAGSAKDGADVVTASIILSGAERRSIHRPEVCLTGQGWSLLDAKTIPVSLGDNQQMMVRDLFMEKPVTAKDGTRRIVRAHYVYWFVGSAVTTPSHWTRMWLSARDSILRNVNHRWAYPAMMAVVTDNPKADTGGERHRTADETLTLIKNLIRELAPTFQKSLMAHTVAQSTP